MTKSQKYLKRFLDIFLSIFSILIFIIPIIILVLISTLDTGKFGVFTQDRIGRNAKIFKIFKVRTYNKIGVCTPLGKLLRKHKFDELPQLFNVLYGNMSFVGPRPDIIGYADQLSDTDKIILNVKPGITGPATLKFMNEQSILENKVNPNDYNLNIIWPEKVRLNKEYVKNYHIFKDIKYLIKTIFNVVKNMAF